MVPGGHLASLHSLETSEFLADLSLNTLNSNMVWVGASDKYKVNLMTTWLNTAQSFVSQFMHMCNT